MQYKKLEKIGNSQNFQYLIKSQQESECYVTIKIPF